MPSDIKERVVARNVKTLDRAALLQKAARPAALRVGETAKAANPATSPSFISETSSLIYAPHSGPKVRCEMVFLASATVSQTLTVLSLR